MKKLPIFGILYHNAEGTRCMQPVKAKDQTHARQKFAKRYPSIPEEAIIDTTDEIVPNTTLYRTIKSQAI